MILKHSLCSIYAAFLIILYFDGSLAHNVQRRQVLDNSCAPLDDIPNGNFIIVNSYLRRSYTSGSYIPNKSVLAFYCNPDYKLSPRTEIVACIEGVWNQTIPTCVPEGSLNEAVEEVRDEIDECGYWNEGFQAPWHVGIYRKNNNDYRYLCGGSIVSSNVIVTAAHCFTDVNNKKINSSDLYIGAGKWHSEYWNIADWTAQYSQVKKYIIAENYRGVHSNLEGDLGLIIVTNPFSTSFYVHPICIDWENRFEDQQLTPGNIGYVQGWGYSDLVLKTPSTTLQQLGVPFVETQNCLDTVPRNFHKYVTDDKFCAGYTNGSCVCNGDDGGGLVFGKTENDKTKYYIRGLVSTFPQINGACDTSQYGVYTKISSYKNLIQSVVNENKVKKTRNI